MEGVDIISEDNRVFSLLKFIANWQFAQVIFKIKNSPTTAGI